MVTRQGLAVGAGDRAGAGAALGFNQAKRWPWVLVLNQGKPRPWGPVIELVQAQHWASTRQSPGPGCRCSIRQAPGCGPACAWSWHWCSPGKALALGAGAELVGTAPMALANRCKLHLPSVATAYTGPRDWLPSCPLRSYEHTQPHKENHVVRLPSSRASIQESTERA